MEVAIIGAGFTGLACATSLLKAGVTPTLYERGSTIGGLAAGFQEPTWTSSLENYYHHWFCSDAYVAKFAKTWGLEKNVIFSRPLTAMQTIRHGFVQLDSASSLLRYPELNLKDKLRMGAALAYLRFVKNWRPLEKYTAERWCRRYMGDRGFDAIWRPLLEGKFGYHAPDINMAWLWARLATRTSELGTYKGGFAMMMQDVERWLVQRSVSLHKNVDVSVEPIERGWRITTGEMSKEYDRLVIAAGPETFKTICGSHAPQYTQSLKALTAIGAQVVVLSLDQGVGPYYWYSLRKTKAQPFLALIEHTNFVPREEFGGEHLVYLADYVEPASSDWNRSDEELTSLAVATCASLNPSLTQRNVQRSWVFRAPYAQPIMGCSASERIPPLHVPKVPGLYHASMSHVYPWDRGTNFALELGDRVAKHILNSPKRT